MLSYNWALSLAIRTFHVHARFHSDFFVQLLLLVIHSSHIFAIATSCILLALVVYLVLLSLLSDPFQLFAFISTPSLVLRTLALHSIRGHQTFAFLRRIGSCLLLLNWIPSECSAYLAWFCLPICFVINVDTNGLSFSHRMFHLGLVIVALIPALNSLFGFAISFRPWNWTSNSLFAPKTCTC